MNLLINYVYEVVESNFSNNVMNYDLGDFIIYIVVSMSALET